MPLIRYAVVAGEDDYRGLAFFLEDGDGCPIQIPDLSLPDKYKGIDYHTIGRQACCWLNHHADQALIEKMLTDPTRQRPWLVKFVAYLTEVARTYLLMVGDGQHFTPCQVCGLTIEPNHWIAITLDAFIGEDSSTTYSGPLCWQCTRNVVGRSLDISL